MQFVSNGDTTCMKYQILFSGKNKKNIINLSSTELAKRAVKVNTKLLGNGRFTHFAIWEE